MTRCTDPTCWRLPHDTNDHATPPKAMAESWRLVRTMAEWDEFLASEHRRDVHRGNVAGCLWCERLYGKPVMTLELGL